MVETKQVALRGSGQGGVEMVLCAPAFPDRAVSGGVAVRDASPPRPARFPAGAGLGQLQIVFVDEPVPALLGGRELAGLDEMPHVPGRDAQAGGGFGGGGEGGGHWSASLNDFFALSFINKFYHAGVPIGHSQ